MIKVEHTHRFSTRGILDKVILRRAVAGAMRRTVENLERELPEG